MKETKKEAGFIANGMTWNQVEARIREVLESISKWRISGKTTEKHLLPYWHSHCLAAAVQLPRQALHPQQRPQIRSKSAFHPMRQTVPAVCLFWKVQGWLKWTMQLVSHQSSRMSQIISITLKLFRHTQTHSCLHSMNSVHPQSMAHMRTGRSHSTERRPDYRSSGSRFR